MRRPGVRPPVAATTGRTPTAARRPPGPAWLEPRRPRHPRAAPRRAAQPVRADDDDEPAFNPFAPAAQGAGRQPVRDEDDEPADNPFAPAPAARPAGRRRRAAQAAPARPRPRGLRLVREGPARGRRARRLRPVRAAVRLPARARARASSTRASRRRRCPRSSPASRRRPRRAGAGLAAMLVEAVCDDLAGRGFAAVEAYPEVGARARRHERRDPGVLGAPGLRGRGADERFPVLRRELGVRAVAGARARPRRGDRARGASRPSPAAATPSSTPRASTATAPTGSVDRGRAAPPASEPGQSPRPGGRGSSRTRSLLEILPAAVDGVAVDPRARRVRGRGRRPGARRDVGGRPPFAVVVDRRRHLAVGRRRKLRPGRLQRRLLPRLARRVRRGRVRARPAASPAQPRRDRRPDRRTSTTCDRRRPRLPRASRSGDADRLAALGRGAPVRRAAHGLRPGRDVGRRDATVGAYARSR